MSQKKPALGKGLGALLGELSARPATAGSTAVPIAVPAASTRVDAKVGGSFVAGAVAAASNVVEAESARMRVEDGDLARLPIDSLQRGRYQPRVDLRQESLEELANSIKSQGVIQPIVVRPLDMPGAPATANTRYEIIAGERRWRAAQMAGLAEIPAVIRRVPDEAAIAIALIENIQREDLNPLEEARALDRLIREFGVTHQQAADAVGRSRATVTNLLRLLDLAPEVATRVETRELEMGHARALLGLPTRGEQAAAAAVIVQRGLSVRGTEALVRQMLQSSTSTAARKAPAMRDANVSQLEQELSDKLGARVEFQTASSGRGRVVLHYNSLDELEGILAHIK